MISDVLCNQVTVLIISVTTISAYFIKSQRDERIRSRIAESDAELRKEIELQNLKQDAAIFNIQFDQINKLKEHLTKMTYDALFKIRPFPREEIERRLREIESSGDLNRYTYEDFSIIHFSVLKFEESLKPSTKIHEYFVSQIQRDMVISRVSEIYLNMK